MSNLSSVKTEAEWNREKDHMAFVSAIWEDRDEAIKLLCDLASGDDETAYKIRTWLRGKKASVVLEEGSSMSSRMSMSELKLRVREWFDRLQRDRRHMEEARAGAKPWLWHDDQALMRGFAQATFQRMADDR